MLSFNNFLRIPFLSHCSFKTDFYLEVSLHYLFLSGKKSGTLSPRHILGELWNVRAREILKVILINPFISVIEWRNTGFKLFECRKQLQQLILSRRIFLKTCLTNVSTRTTTFYVVAVWVQVESANLFKVCSRRAEHQLGLLSTICHSLPGNTFFAQVWSLGSPRSSIQRALDEE